MCYLDNRRGTLAIHGPCWKFTLGSITSNCTNTRAQKTDSQRALLVPSFLSLYYLFSCCLGTKLMRHLCIYTHRDVLASRTQILFEHQLQILYAKASSNRTGKDPYFPNYRPCWSHLILMLTGLKHDYLLVISNLPN